MCFVYRSVALIAVIAAVAVAIATASGAQRAHRTVAAAGCQPQLRAIAHGQGSPDDLVWDGQNLLSGDLARGTVAVIAHGHARTIASHFAAPEGIVPGPKGSLIVAAQKTNSIVEQPLPTGKPRTLLTLPLPHGAEGVDGINADGAGAIFVPDSARGRLYVLQLSPRKVTLVNTGMTRPVAAIRWQGAIVVADEYANAVWRIAGGHRTRLATVPVADDLAVISHHLIASSLLGGVWEVTPHVRQLTDAFAPTASDPQGMVADGPDALILSDQSRNTIYRLSNLAGCL
jgi:DNA-binding beta-propeller fold protein YncE